MVIVTNSEKKNFLPKANKNRKLWASEAQGRTRIKSFQEEDQVDQLSCTEYVKCSFLFGLLEQRQEKLVNKF